MLFQFLAYEFDVIFVEPSPDVQSRAIVCTYRLNSGSEKDVNMENMSHHISIVIL
jgi:hypothetical protein